MLNDSLAGPVRQQAGGHAFWWRLADNLFRRLPWFLIPVIAMGLLGFSQANKTNQLFYSGATLSASSNPLVPDQPISGVTNSGWESPAAATSRLINERLRTDLFLKQVAERAQLGAAVDSGALDLSVLRSGIWASAEGDSILKVNATTSSPKVSYDLVAATIAEFQEFVMQRAASDYAEAESFWTDQLTSLQAEQETARTKLTDFAASLPVLGEGEERPLADQLTMGSLTSELETIDAKIAAAENSIDQAKLAQTQHATEAGETLDVIDQPKVSAAPQSTLRKKVMLVGSYLMLGVVIAAAALLVTTMLDHTVASAADLLAMPEITLVATVPTVRLLNTSVRRRSLLPRRLTRTTSRTDQR